MVLRAGEQHAGRLARPTRTGKRPAAGNRRALPADLPTGYHDFYASGKTPATKRLATASRCGSSSARGAAFCRPICGCGVGRCSCTATRSRASWGIGDLADLARLGEWARPLGAGMLVVNPLDAVAPTLPQESSPYFPSSRRFLNPLYLSIEAVPGYGQLQGELAPLAAEARALNARRLIDRDAVFRLKMAALEKLWRRVCRPDEQFDRYAAARGESLRQFAVYCALAEKFGANWHDWDGAYHDAHGPAVRAWAAESADRCRFFAWLQWLCRSAVGRRRQAN